MLEEFCAFAKFLEKTPRSARSLRTWMFLATGWSSGWVAGGVAARWLCSAIIWPKVSWSGASTVCAVVPLGDVCLPNGYEGSLDDGGRFGIDTHAIRRTMAQARKHRGNVPRLPGRLSRAGWRWCANRVCGQGWVPPAGISIGPSPSV